MKLFVYITSAVFALNVIFADDHGNSSGGLPEGGFSTFHVVAEDPYEYIDFLKANPAALKAGGGDAVGYCMTMTGHDYPGEMFIWNAYSSLDKALSDGFAYNPYKASKQLKSMRKLLYTAVWKPLTPFPLNPGFERVTRVIVKPENTQKFLMMSEKLQTEINAAGEEFEMGVLLALGGGANENNLMVRAIAPDGKSFGELYEKGYSGSAPWGATLQAMQSLIDEVVRDSHEQCGYLLAAE
tara:strand:- start:24 stop:743 length:720 start_codon:yes stop_codon:yes gene_type:complete